MMKTMKFTWIMRTAGAVAGVLAVGALALAGVAYAQIPTFAQTSVTVGVGQSTTITSENQTDVYVGSNSAPTIVSISINGTQATFTGVAPGSSIVSLCGVGTASDCTNLSVTVSSNGGSTTSGLSFSQNNFSLAVGGNQTVTVSGGNGTYSISGISNSSVASASLSGSSLTVSGLGSGNGTISVCDTSGDCGTLSATVGSGSSSSTSGLTFSQNNLSLVTGGSAIVTISGGNGSFSVSNNSNSSAVAISIAGGSVTAYASEAGSATITICDTSNDCGALSVTVNTLVSSQAVAFSPSNPTIAAGQSQSVTLSGGATGYIIFSNSSPNVVQASMNGGSTLVLYGETAGTASVTLCATGGGCSSITVTVTGTSSSTTGAPSATTATNTVVPSTTAIPTPISTPTVPSPSVVANSALLTEIQALQTAVTQALAQINSIQTELNQLEAQVAAGSGSGIGTSASVSSSGASSEFTELLTVGTEDAQVTVLQNRLTTLGFYSGPITGYYGALTEQAVMKYQTSQGIEATGSVGPETRASLNAGE